VTERRGRRRKKPLEDRKEKRGHSKLKEETLEITQWKTRFGRRYGPPVRQTTGWTNEWVNAIFVTVQTSQNWGDT